MIIRPAVASDAEALTGLIFRSKASNGYDVEFMEACRDELRVSTHSLTVAEYWVADEAGPVGCFALATDGSVARVENFFVDPDYQRKGIGRKLWAKIQARAVETGCNRLILDADPNALPFYEAMGFSVVGEVPSGSISGRMLPRMELSL